MTRQAFKLLLGYYSIYVPIPNRTKSWVQLQRTLTLDTYLVSGVLLDCIPYPIQHALFSRFQPRHKLLIKYMQQAFNLDAWRFLEAYAATDTNLIRIQPQFNPLASLRVVVHANHAKQAVPQRIHVPTRAVPVFSPSFVGKTIHSSTLLYTCSRLALGMLIACSSAPQASVSSTVACGGARCYHQHRRYLCKNASDNASLVSPVGC